MDCHEAPDPNLIQKGVIVTKKRNEKYLKKDASGIWHLNFRVPVRFGGKLFRHRNLNLIDFVERATWTLLPQKTLLERYSK